MGKTTQVAADRAFDKTKTVLPTEVARGVYIEHPPSAQALKLMHLLISLAGGRMAEDVHHEMRLSDIKQIEGMRNHSRATLRRLFIELAGAVLVYDDTEAQMEIIGGFMDKVKLDYRHEVSDDLLVKWWFGGAFREMAEKSNHWAIMDRQTVFALSSKYSILLFQHITSLTGLNHVQHKTFSVSELRAVLGVPDEKLKRWNDVNNFALKPAIAEINQLSRMTLTATPRKIGRSVASVKIAWEVKPDPTEAKKELSRPKHGRKSRRNGTAETPVVAFPDSGGIRYAEPWQGIAKTNGSGKDINLIGNDFRNWCAAKKIPLDGSKIARQFETFCKGVSL